MNTSIKTIFTLYLVITISYLSTAQVAINETGNQPNASAILDVQSTNKGILIPRMTDTERNNISNPATGLMVYVTTDNSFYYYNGTAWNQVGKGWALQGNSGTDPSTDFIGTSDSTALVLRTNNEPILRLYPSTGMGETGNIIGGSQSNTISSTSIGSIIVGGGASNNNNEIDGNYNILGGGAKNRIHTSSDYSVLGGGKESNLSGDYSFMGGGLEHSMTADFATIGGGAYNIIGGKGATIPGGAFNTANGEYSFAAGQDAIADHNASFVWSDGSYPFSSTATKQFLVYAANGVGINKNNPATALDVNGTVTATLFSGDGSGLTNIDTDATNEIQTLSISSHTISLTNGGSVNLSSYDNANTTIVQDADNDTKIQVEESADEDIIRFDIGGDEGLRLLKSANGHTRLEVVDSRYNTIIGEEAGLNLDTYPYQFNVFLGYWAGRQSHAADYNTFIGSYAGLTNSSGKSNTFIGSSSGYKTTTGNYNTFLGDNSGYKNSTGEYNTYVGKSAGAGNTTGTYNTFLGNSAGRFNEVGDSCVFIGHQAGHSETGSSKLYIANSKSSSPLIYGEFNNDLLRINGTLDINNAYAFPTNDGTNGQVLTTNGSGNATWTTLSDNDNQDLKLINHTLSLTNDASTVDLSPYLDNTDNQDLRLTNNMLSLTNDASTVDLSSYLDNTDNQDLTLTNNILSLTNDASTVDLNPYLDADDLGNHTATQNMNLDGNWISNDGSNEGIQISNSGQVTLTASNPVLTFLDNTSGLGNERQSKIENVLVSHNSTAADQKMLFKISKGTTSGTNTIMTIRGDTAVGIGTTDPATILHTSSSTVAEETGFKITQGTYNTVFYHNTNGDMVIRKANQTNQLVLDKDGKIGINRDPVTNTLEVGGQASKSSAGSWVANSDARLKKNIQPLNSNQMLDKLLALQGVTYEWNDNKTGNERPTGIQYGFTAQNIQDNFPTLVEEDNLGYLQTAYGTYDAMTIEAIRALNDKIITLEKENTILKTQVNRINELEANLELLKSLIVEQ